MSDDVNIQTYLGKVLTLLNDNLSSVVLVSLIRTSDCHAICWQQSDKTFVCFAIKFVKLADYSKDSGFSAEYTPQAIENEIYSHLAQRAKLVDTRIVIADYKKDMDRADKMADTIMRTFQVTSIFPISDSNINLLTCNKLICDWNMDAVRSLENQWSPHGIRPRLEVGMVLKIATGADEYPTIGVIGGYTDFIEKESRVVDNHRLVLYQPVFHITTLMAQIPLEGVAAILLSAFAPTIYQTKFWLKQWDGVRSGCPNPGNLEKYPPSSTEQLQLTNNEELLDFIQCYCATPIITYQLLNGRDTIPGIKALVEDNGKNSADVIKRLMRFFDTSDDPFVARPIRVVGERYVGGIVNDNNQTLIPDSNTIDYLEIAASIGAKNITAETRRILLTLSSNKEVHLQALQDYTGNKIVPLWINVISIINPDFIKWLIGKISDKNLNITDPCAKPVIGKLPISSSIPDGEENKNKKPSASPVSSRYFLEEINQEIARVKNWLNNKGFDSTTSIHYIASQYRTDLKKLYRTIKEDLEN